MGKVIYLNAWLNCPDEILRENYRLQVMISEAKAKFWYDMREQKIDQYQVQLCYDRWVHSNRDRLKIARESDQAL
jgi:hypothetical protein